MIGVLIAALLDVKAQSLRTLAVMIGLGTAVAAVILVNAATVLSQRANAEYSETTFGASATYQINLSETAQLFPASEVANGVSRLDQLFAELGDTHVTRFVSAPVVILQNGLPQQAGSTMWVSSTFPLVSPTKIVAGVFPRATAAGPVVHAVVTESLLRQLGIDPATAVGSVLRYGDANTLNDPRRDPSWSLIVDAVASQLGPTQNPLNLVLVSDAASIPGFAGSGGAGWLLTMPPRDGQTLDQLLAHIVAPDGTTPLFTARRQDTNDAIAPLLDQQQLTGQIAALIVLLVAALGLIGIGLSSTRERAQEFGLRRAIGVNRLRIFAGVVVQTVMEAAVAGVFGIAMSFVLVIFVARRLVLSQLPLPSNIGLPLESAAVGMVAALVVGLIASLLPALRASRLSVARALRD